MSQVSTSHTDTLTSTLHSLITTSVHSLSLLLSIMSNSENLMDTGPFEKLTHGNYHAWAPRTKAKLMELSVWRFCTGNEIIPPRPTAPFPAPNASRTEVTTLN
jgi:hypothetical protein